MKWLIRRIGSVFFGLHKRAPFVTVGACLLLIYLAVLTAGLQAMTAILDHIPGVVSTKTTVHLPFTAKLLIVGTALLVALGSVIAGGLAKWMYKPYKSNSVLLIHILTGGGVFLVGASMVRDLQPILAKGEGGDNAWLLSYLGFWLLMAGYMLKAPWDELRDRMSAWVDGVSGLSQGSSPDGTKKGNPMLSAEAKMILSLLKTSGAMDGQDIESKTRLSEPAIKKAAVELREHGFVKTTGAPNGNEDNGMEIDRLTITPLGQSAR